MLDALPFGKQQYQFPACSLSLLLSPTSILTLHLTHQCMPTINILSKFMNEDEQKRQNEDVNITLNFETVAFFTKTDKTLTTMLLTWDKLGRYVYGPGCES